MPFVRDPCGVVCLIFTYLAVFYADYVVTRWIILLNYQNSWVILDDIRSIINIYTNFTRSCRLWGPFNVVLFNTIVFLLVMSHLKAVFLDPGTVPLPSSRLDFSDLHSNKSEYENDDWTVCTRCETFRPPRAHHCRICKRCIRRMDHHW